ncbi:hypothetical protein GLOIN_2v1695653 [Rhizophagus irregularis DAOM 181602=DAOM 197198]|uniref:Uncharacterized protein n=1 Tax=Rhizophagus irregularis (strain DAOM 181602 / DAOM 197198 / MUCL 43194) TaxID=747089 RepID=A0A2P4PAU5_RHIID|nr:hypothetical protein GLOIN_2v1695653 [Rhizophagus irregularis DAOM 181602=DAOM 197198]POG62491.1 hypothetical protein GLOIN_2v1695653 [Rhizophagus irregularis DAOM 181602=DAOM 197198]|eukprot:XP_025169357.1 hypothetical protein GLOIN_2v1695653 [Rhizophagus irregularis DAOM 181602=DAOM 197198]
MAPVVQNYRIFNVIVDRTSESGMCTDHPFYCGVMTNTSAAASHMDEHHSCHLSRTSYKQK